MLAFAAVTGAPTFASCRVRAPRRCAPASSSLRAPDRGDTDRTAPPRAEVTIRHRGFAPTPAPTPVVAPRPFELDGALALPTTGARVRLHERAAPRLPLRL